jgi:hypothetical protein
MKDEAKQFLDCVIDILSGTPNAFYKNFISLEGLPCSGKTSVIRGINKEQITHNELRIPRNLETNEGYFWMEENRAEFLKAALDELVLADRSIISTINYKAAHISFTGDKRYGAQLDILNHIRKEQKLALPSKIILLDVSPKISCERQAVRDRDILEGRIWYDECFLHQFHESYSYLLQHLYKNDLHVLDSEVLSLGEVTNQVEKIIRGIYK